MHFILIAFRIAQYKTIVSNFEICFTMWVLVSGPGVGNRTGRGASVGKQQ